MPTVHLAVYDTLADWEPGHLLAELRTGRFTGVPHDVVTVARRAEPVTTMGGLRIQPDLTLDELDPAAGALLVLPGAAAWDEGGNADFAAAAGAALAAGTPVAAICGATFGLAAAGLLDDRTHTSAALEYLQLAGGYAGADHYVDARAATGEGLTTAGPQSPVQFATETLTALGLLTPELRAAYEGVFHAADPAAFAALQGAAPQA